MFIGLRSAIGVIFIVHGMGKFNPGFANFLPNMGLPPEMQIPIALAEVVPGILLIIGVFSRLSSALLSIIMIGGNIPRQRSTKFDRRFRGRVRFDTTSCSLGNHDCRTRKNCTSTNSQKITKMLALESKILVFKRQEQERSFRLPVKEN